MNVWSKTFTNSSQIQRREKWFGSSIQEHISKIKRIPTIKFKKDIGIDRVKIQKALC